MTSNLRKHLILSSPSDITEQKVWDGLDADYMSAAPAFQFRRSREIDVQANDTLMQEMSDIAVALWHQKNGVNAVRQFLESLWVPDADDATPATIEAIARGFITDYIATEDDGVPLLFCPLSDGATSEPVSDGTVIVWAKYPGTNEQCFFMLGSNSPEAFQAANFLGDSDKYKHAWATMVDSAKRVFIQADANHSSHEYLDLSVGAIIQRFPFLSEQKMVTTSIRDKLKELISTESDYGLMQALFHEVQDLNQQIAVFTRSISSLAGYASSKGYHLIQKPDTLRVTQRGVARDGFSVQPGDLVQTYSYVTNWIEEQHIPRSRKRFLRSTKRWTEVRRVRRSAVDVGNRLIESQDSMVSDFVQSQPDGKNVVVLQNVAAGLQADDGRTLDSIMEQCELDENFRRSCVLLMPVYTQNLFGEDIVAGYHVIRQPMRGRRIVALPDFYLEEQISYKLRWLGMELGELISSINLLPGEMRDISVKVKRTSLREEELKSVQSIETESSRSFDTVTSIENEFQKENTSEKTKSWSVKASGSYGGFSAGGSTSGSSKKTARQFAKNLNKLTTQAISKLRKSSRSEVVSRELTREELESTTSSSGQISNPNVGRTLNVNYFAINNVFASSTYLDDIGFTYISPFELIDGTDIREVRTFSKEQLPEFLESVEDDVVRMLSMGLYFGNEALSRAQIMERAQSNAKDYVARLKADYLMALADYSTNDPETAVPEKNPIPAFNVKSNDDDMRALDPTRDVDLQSLINDLVATGEAIEPDIVISPSAAVYADAMTGETEGLESYAVDMRKLEVEKQMAEITTIMTTTKGKSKTSLQAHYNVSHRKVSDTQVEIQIGGDINVGTWTYRVGAREIGSLNVVADVFQYTLDYTAGALSDDRLDHLPGSLVRHA